MKDPNVREHDGTNFRGLTVHCPKCKTPLIGASETRIGLCARCAPDTEQSICKKIRRALRSPTLPLP